MGSSQCFHALDTLMVSGEYLSGEARSTQLWSKESRFLGSLSQVQRRPALLNSEEPFQKTGCRPDALPLLHAVQPEETWHNSLKRMKENRQKKNLCLLSGEFTHEYRLRLHDLFYYQLVSLSWRDSISWEKLQRQKCLFLLSSRHSPREAARMVVPKGPRGAAAASGSRLPHVLRPCLKMQRWLCSHYYRNWPALFLKDESLGNTCVRVGSKIQMSTSRRNMQTSASSSYKTLLLFPERRFHTYYWRQ